ncbi:CHASE2 domain-containing protein [Candidatus Parabeggiatoa sp. HSG14]|uniref:CHASE2 domain-containing protein n=1 Tax=Candidatus Parabeggiatoa sp. HSG14 TaxID=3055593 RepID=UPI0025A755C3|nr:CHASE2 domain-containing protein [Thiotrichales bacterium HSG14]
MKLLVGFSIVLGLFSLAVFVLNYVLQKIRHLFLHGKMGDISESKPSNIYGKIVFNLVIGLGFIYLVMTFFYSIPKLGEAEDGMIDLIMPLYQEWIPSIQKNKIPPFVFLNIDSNTYDKWGVQSTPRDKLKNLIDVAKNAKARLIVVDIDVSQSDKEKLDKQLKEYLVNHVTDCNKAKKDSELACPPIIFGRVFKSSSGDIILTPRKGFLDEVITEESISYLQWASVEFLQSGVTNQVRRWRLWEYTCSEDKQEEGIIPSVELLVMGLVQDGCTVESIRNSLRPLQPKSCHIKEDYHQQSLPKNITLCNLTISTDRQNLQHRIMYRIPWQPLVHDNSGKPVLTIRPAEHYAEEKSLEHFDLTAFKDSIVVIGASNRDAQDIVSTPIEDMPGSLLFINAVYTLLQYGTIKPVPMWISLLIAAFFIVITTISFYSNKGKWVSVFLFAIIGLLVAVSFFLLYHGMWLNVILPLLIVKLYQMFSGAKEWLSRPKEKKSTSDISKVSL